MNSQSSTIQPTPQALMNMWRNRDCDPPYFTNFQNSLKYPRDEGFFEMLTYTCLPTFKFASMTFLLILLNTLYFIISLLYDDIQYGGSLLEPNQNSLYSLKMQYPYYIKYYHEYQRAVLSLLLYNNFVNYFSCQIAISVFGSYVEKLLGWKKLWMISLVSGVGGILFSCCFTSQAHVNGTSIPSSHIGVLFGYTTIKWNQWNYSGSGRWQMIWIQFVGMSILLWQAYQWPINDGYAMIGSFSIGYLLAWVFVNQLSKPYDDDNKCLMWMSLFVVVIFYGCVIFYFFWNVNPQLIQI